MAECGGLGGEKEPPAETRLSQSIAGPGGGAGERDPKVSSSSVLPVAFGSLVHAGPPARAKHRRRRAKWVWRVDGPHPAKEDTG